MPKRVKQSAVRRRLLPAITLEHIRLFRRRARHHNNIGYAVMSLIFVLFGLAVYVFVFAQNIDKPKGSVELFDELQTAKKGQGLIVEFAEKEFEEKQNGAVMGITNTFDVLNATAIFWDAKIKLLLLTEKERLMRARVYYPDVDTAKSKEEILVQVNGLQQYLVALGNIRDTVRKHRDVGMGSDADVSQAERFVAEAQSKLELTEQRATLAPEAQAIRSSAANMDSLELVRTSLVRFGGVGVTLFLISLLIPIYRYNVRLATFYMARGDALELFRDTKLEKFGEMVKWLTPTHAFEKEPSTPMEAAASMLRNAGSLAKRA
jgi:hypothetical protein